MRAPGVGEEQERIGLCACCRHVRRVRSDRGSVFYRCGRSDSDPGFPRYPALPVRQCQGHELAVEEE